MSRTVRLLITSASAAALAFAVASPAAASPVQVLNSSTDTVVLAAAESKLDAQLGSSFGNAWLDAETGQLTVGVTDRSMFAQVRAAGAVPKLVQRSALELESVVSALNATVDSRPKSITEWYVDAQSNTVVVSVLGSDPAANRWLAGRDVKVQQVTEAPRLLWDVVGGRPLYLPSGRCSVGFNTRIPSSGNRYILTAGHCTGQNGTYSGDGGSVGGRAGQYFPTYDFGAVGPQPSAAVSVPRVSRYSSGGTVTVAGSALAGNGSSICRSGSTTGWRCGTLLARGATVCYPQGCVYDMIRTNACAEPGDSGGSMVTNGGSGARVQAQGMTSGGSGNCSSGGTTYFEPVNRGLNYWGLQLITG